MFLLGSALGNNMLCREEMHPGFERMLVMVDHGQQDGPESWYLVLVPVEALGVSPLQMWELRLRASYVSSSSWHS